MATSKTLNSNLMFEFCPRLQRMVEQGKSIDGNHQTIEITGLSSTNNLQCIRAILLRHQYRKTLEIGLAYGGSALTILTTLSEIHADQNFSHTAIDPYQEKYCRNSGLAVVQAEGLEQHFHFLEEFSMFALPALIKANEKFDLIYIDGSHLFADVFTDFHFSMRLLNMGGMLLFDDCTDTHVRKVIRFIYKNCSHFLAPANLSTYIQKPFLKQLVNQLGYRQLEAFELIAEPHHLHGKPLNNF